ncbi:MAG: tetratricopeptide repeat protein [Acidobacteria bacterium]|nr:tetratricopeptide repeat protein [Acidobacteriota bacterium]
MITRVSRILILALLSSVMCADGKLSAPFSTRADAAGLIQDSPVTQLLDSAQAGIRRGDLAGAAVALEQALALEKGNKTARMALVNVLMRLTRWEEAEQHAQILRQQFPDETGSFYFLALIAFQRGQLPVALEMANQCLERGDRRSEVYKLLALIEYLLQQYDKFEAHIRETIKLNPTDADAYYHLGRYYFEDKRYKEALGAFQTAFKIQPAHYKAHYYAGLLHEGENDGERVKQEYQAAIQIIELQKIRYPWPFTDLGKWLVNEGEYDRGVGWLYRATRNDPTSPHAWYHYAKALFQNGASFEVKEAILEAIRLDPGYSEAYYLLARYYQKTGEDRLSKETFAKFDDLKKNPIPSPYGLRRW